MMVNLSNLFDIGRNLYALPAYNDRSGKAPIPLRYFFELTYRCNLQCPYCYVGKDRNKNELTTEEWFNIIEQIPFYSFVTLVGGEPLIRKDFIDILMKTAKKTFGKLNVVSNGILMNSRPRRPMVDIKTIILENNLDDIVKLYKMCDEMKFNFLSISFLRNNNLKQNSVLFDSFVPEFNENYPIQKYFDMEHFKEVYKELESLSKNSKVQIRWSPKFEYSKNPLEKIEEFFNTPADKAISEIYKPCMYPYSNMMITPAGDVYPCLSQKIGNVKDLPLKDVFNLPHYRCFRKNLHAAKVFGACQMCCELCVK